jgi:hypothetical protein
MPLEIFSHGARSNPFGRTSGIGGDGRNWLDCGPGEETNEGTPLPDFKRSVVIRSVDKAAASPAR